MVDPRAHDYESGRSVKGGMVLARAESSNTHTRFVRAIALFYAAQFAVIGVQAPFLPIWLDARGFDAGSIGLALAAPMALRVLIVPPAMRLVDRLAVTRIAIVAAAGLAALSYALAGSMTARGPLLAAAIAAMTLFALTFPLGDAYALRGLAERGRAYGPVRLWGSVAFMAANIAGGLSLGVIAADHLIWIIFGTVTATAVAGAMLAPGARDLADGAGQAAGQLLWRIPGLSATLAAAALVQASHAVVYGFASIDWSAKGYGGTTIGALWALGVVAEIVLFALSARLPGWLAPLGLVALGACGAVIRWTIMAFDQPLALLPFLQLLHALSFGATHLGTLQFIARAAPARMAARAQGAISVALGLAMALAIALSGLLFARFGSLAYAAMALMALAGLACALAARRFGEGPQVGV
ncbi:MAG: MFS transporter [Proteobacteria bacterium]|nr:MFS transporter [Pseudomonadota bacterium]